MWVRIPLTQQMAMWRNSVAQEAYIFEVVGSNPTFTTLGEQKIGGGKHREVKLIVSAKKWILPMKFE